jgi:hypothetical protein
MFEHTIGVRDQLQCHFGFLICALTTEIMFTESDGLTFLFILF